MEEESLSEAQKRTCLEKCLQQLPEGDRDLVVRFRVVDEGKKLDNRKQLAQSLGISQKEFRLRVYRIRHALKDCISSCLQHEQEQTDDT